MSYLIILKALREIEQGHDDYTAKASGLLNRMERFDAFFGLQLGRRIFFSSEQLSSNLQAKDITVQEATRDAALLVSHFRTLRTEAMFDQIYYEIVLESEGLTDEPVPPRYRKLSRRLDRGQVSHQYVSLQDRCALFL